MASRGKDLGWLIGLVAVVAAGAGLLRVRTPSAPVMAPAASASLAPASQAVGDPTPVDPARLTQPDSQDVVLETRRGRIVFELYPNAAPLHVAAIKAMVQRQFYDGILFHRVIPGFMIQFGDPNTRKADHSRWGMGDPSSPKLSAEFTSLPHHPGTVAMARTSDPDSATTQFYICVGSPAFLDGKYTVFGQVIAGQDIADAISKVPRDSRDTPLKDEKVTRAYLTPHAGPVRLAPCEP